MLHGVFDQESDHSWVPLRPRTSRKLLKDLLTLANRYLTFVSLDDALSMISGERPMVNNACVVTFDDGQLNNVDCALPILRELTIPCTLYLSTHVIDNQTVYWFDRLDYAIQQQGLHGIDITVNDDIIKIDQSDRNTLSDNLSKLIKTLKKGFKTDSEFQKCVSSICDRLESLSGTSIQQLNNTDLWSAPMTWDDTVACGNSKDVIIGSHTINHARLSITDHETIKMEVSYSKEIIENRIGIPCDHFCYPNGDWDSETAKIVKDAGYKSAVTTDVGFNRLNDNPFLLKRISFPYNSPLIYGLFGITGVNATYSSLKSSISSFLS
jgi:peptidoglycan/xylan/chitin deacetylase (PgdA/CDA1 family)